MSLNYPYPVPEEHQPFLDEFRALVAKHPAAARRFALADLDDNEPGIASIPTIIFECTRDEDGAVFCHRVHEQ
jgi:hypothetical protein